MSLMNFLNLLTLCRLKFIIKHDFIGEGGVKLMVEVANQNDLDTMQNQFYKVFKNTDPFGELFHDSIEHRLILCPVKQYRLNKDQYHALLQATKAEGDTIFYITETELEDCFSIAEPHFIQPRSWQCSLQLSFDDYDDNWFYLENTIYSPNGKWGLMISHEDHAVLGGSKLFIDTFTQYYAEWSEGYDNFIKMWDENKKLYNLKYDWIDGFLKHVYR
ncbi:hypothetical protein D1872_164670 [compost metagenome]